MDVSRSSAHQPLNWAMNGPKRLALFPQCEVTRLAHRDRYCAGTECRLSGVLRKSALARSSDNARTRTTLRRSVLVRTRKFFTLLAAGAHYRKGWSHLSVNTQDRSAAAVKLFEGFGGKIESGYPRKDRRL